MMYITGGTNGQQMEGRDKGAGEVQGKELM